jgi:5-methylcytosine-specific restriction endonuclease McrA
MAGIKKGQGPQKQAEILSDIQRDSALRGQTYRERALKLFPHICGRCGREFSGKRLRELTVHHIDNNHMNNPEDGSNWELLCLYCHDNEHEPPERTGLYDGPAAGINRPTLGFKAFEGLKDLLIPKAAEPECQPPENTEPPAAE